MYFEVTRTISLFCAQCSDSSYLSKNVTYDSRFSILSSHQTSPIKTLYTVLRNLVQSYTAPAIKSRKMPCEISVKIATLNGSSRNVLAGISGVLAPKGSPFHCVLLSTFRQNCAIACNPTPLGTLSYLAKSVRVTQMSNCVA